MGEEQMKIEIIENINRKNGYKKNGYKKNRYKENRYNEIRYEKKKSGKRMIGIATALLILMGTLVGCSSGQEAPTTTAPTTTIQSSETTNVDTTIAPETTEKTTTTETVSLESIPSEQEVAHIAAMSGPTAIGMVKLMQDAEDGNTDFPYEFQIFGTADEVSAGLIQGTLDMAAVPCNLASVLYQKTEGQIQIAAINTLGVLYIVETGETIQSVEDLKGKTIYSTGQGTTPEYTLNYLLHSYGLDPENDVTIEYRSEAAEVTAILAESEDAIAMLPQPYVTVAMTQNDKLRIALSVTEEWEAVNSDSTVVTGVLVVRSDYAKENSDLVKAFLGEYKESAEYANQDVEGCASLVEKYGIFKAAIATKAIPYCNISLIRGEEMEQKIMGYLETLYQQNPASVGGQLPDKGIFYKED